MEAKKAKESLAITSVHVLPNDTNNHGTFFGGKLMTYVDNIAAIAAMRHARSLVVTASIDSVDFLRPIRVGSSVCLEAFVTWSHHTSMEVFVKIINENLRTGERDLCTTCFLTFVAIDDQGSPTPVPKVVPESEEERELFASAEKRYEQRKVRRQETKRFMETLSLDKPWN